MYIFNGILLSALYICKDIDEIGLSGFACGSGYYQTYHTQFYFFAWGGETKVLGFMATSEALA